MPAFPPTLYPRQCSPLSMAKNGRRKRWKVGMESEERETRKGKKRKRGKGKGRGRERGGRKQNLFKYDLK